MTNQPGNREGIIACPSCGREVPNGEFCGACGAHFSTGSAGRFHAFAAHPHEHVLHPGVVSTLFPHLPHRQAAPFRLSLLAGTLLLLILAVLGLTAADIAVACLIVPLLYLIYLYEAEVYEDEPEVVIGATLVLGIVVGLIFENITGSYVGTTFIQNTLSSASVTRDIVAGVLIPAGAALLMMIGPLILYTRHYEEAMDGFAFGVASGLGFSLARNLVDLWPQLQHGLVTSHPTVDDVLNIAARGLLLPFIAGSATGLIAAALWLHKQPKRRTGPMWWTASRIFQVLAVLAMWIILGIVNIFVSSELTAVLIYAITAAMLLVGVRVSLHHMLLAEAAHVPVGSPAVCLHCHYEVPRMAFCPHCGVATRSLPKYGHGRLARGH